MYNIFKGEDLYPTAAISQAWLYRTWMAGGSGGPWIEFVATCTADSYNKTQNALEYHFFYCVLQGHDSMLNNRYGR